MSRRTFLVTMDGIGLAKPTAVRGKAVRSARWWARRCPGLGLALVRLKGSPS